MSSISLVINLHRYSVDTMQYTLLQHCELLSIMIPRFCFHESLSISGNCRMCLVELKNAPKLIISCSTKVSNNLEFFTNSVLVRKAREMVLEFLLINHPLDCPICDQGGECDLQDQTLVYGSDRGRFSEMKRSVSDKNFGPFIKSVMTRCIHCTKCIRFLENYGSVSSLGVLGRGKNMEIGTYIDTLLESEISGNIIDLCPVGALTSKTYAFSARPWELSSVESIDILDSIGSNILVQTRSNDVLRIIPRCNTTVNESWITDQIRFVYDSFKRQRLLIPYFKQQNSSTLLPCSWSYAFNLFTDSYLLLISTLDKYSLYVFTGNTLDMNSLFMVKIFCALLAIGNLNISTKLCNNLRNTYLLEDSLLDIEYSNFFFIIGLDTKTELPILNMKIKKASSRHSQSINIYCLGSIYSSNYNCVHIGFSTKSLLYISYGKSYICNIMCQINSISLLSNCFKLNSNSSLISVISKLCRLTSNNMCLSISETSVLDINVKASSSFRFSYNKLRTPLWLYLIGSFHFLNLDSYKLFSIFQGSFFLDSMYSCNLFLPISIFIEKTCMYMNCEGRVQISYTSIPKSGNSFSDDDLMYSLYAYIQNRNISSVYSYSYYERRFKWHLPYSNFINEICNHAFTYSKLKNSTYRHFFMSLTYVSFFRTLYTSNLYSCNSINLRKYKLYLKKPTNFFNI